MTESTPLVWDERAEAQGLHAVLSKRYSLEQCEKLDAEQRVRIHALLGDTQAGRLLDLGCGIGRLTIALAAEAGTVVGVDYSSGMLRRAVAAASSAPNAVFVHASATSLPFPDGHFDVVLAHFVYQHIVDDGDFRSAASETARVLRPGGRMVCVDGAYVDNARSVSSYTQARPVEMFVDAFGTALALRSSEAYTMADDAYKITVWTRQPG